MTWHDGMTWELDPGKLTVRDVLAAADAGILSRVLALSGFDPSKFSAEHLRAVAYVAWMAAKQQRPETTLDEVYDLPVAVLSATPEG